MFCPKCGKQLNDDAKFCSKCGAPTVDTVSNDNSDGSVSDSKVTATETDSVKKKSGLLVFMPIVIAISVVLIVIVVGLIALSNPQHRYERQLSLGARYLDELSYEKAIAAYQTAIEIDPKNPKAYEKLSNTYIAMDDTEKALSVLLNGIDETDNEYLRKIYEDMNEIYIADSKSYTDSYIDTQGCNLSSREFIPRLRYKSA